MTRRDRSLLVGAVLLVALALALWFVHQASTVRSGLTASVDDATALQAALVAERPEAAAQALEDLQRHSKNARDASAGVLWSIATHAPAVGDDLDAVRRAARALDRIASDGLPPVVNAYEHHALDRIGPRQGRVDLGAVRALRAPVSQAVRAFTAAQDQLAPIDLDQLNKPVHDAIGDARTKVDQALAQLTGANEALSVLPPMLGGRGDRSYLLLFQNNAEIRSSGGIPGSWAVLRAHQGKLTLGRQGSASSFPVYDAPVLPLTDEERALFGRDLMGTYFQDTNFTPDFPRTAQIAREMYRREFGRRVDGVISVDPVALAGILRAVGPVTLADGSRLTPDNAVKTLVNDPYFTIADPQRQDAYFADAARRIFGALTGGDVDPAQLVKEVGDAVGHRRISLWSAHAEQGTIGDSTVGNVLPTGKAAATSFGVYLSDATGSKMDYYLRYHLDLSADSCLAKGSQHYKARLTMASTAPAGERFLPPYVTGGGDYGTKPGSILTLVRLYGPSGGTIGDVRFNGKAVESKPYTHEGRPVRLTVVLLEPGEKIDITYDASTGAHATGDARVRLTPGVQPDPTVLDVPSACA